MLTNKNKRFKSTKKLPVLKNANLIHSIQLECYKGHFPMSCNALCPIKENCWFYGLKMYKE